MEHLVLPKGAKPDRIIYRGHQDYIGVPFLQYAKDSGREYLVEEKQTTWEECQRQHKIDKDDLAAFLETWLFCGILQEILGMSLESLGLAGLYKHTDFIRAVPRESLANAMGHGTELLYGDTHEKGKDAYEESEDAYEESEDAYEESEAAYKEIKGTQNESRASSFVTVFCATALSWRLDQWSRMIGSHENITQTCDHLTNCLNIGCNALRWIESGYEGASKPVICVTAETVGLAIQSTIDRAQVRLSVRGLPSWSFVGLDQSQIQKMIENGWCAREASGLSKKATSLQLLYFLAHMERRHVDSRHGSCSASTCNASWAIEQPVHRPDCQCEQETRPLGDMRKEVLEILDQDRTPLLEIRRKFLGGFAVRVVPQTRKSRYVAMSHVWADGLGNPREKPLPSCQITNLYKLARELWLSAANSRQSKTLLWIDAICCPMEPGPRRDAVLGKMVEIFESARYVLVLDSELQQIDHRQLDTVETGIRVLSSDWRKRLWTLQESHFARSVWVQFLHGPYNLVIPDYLNYATPVNQKMLVRHLKRELICIINDSESKGWPTDLKTARLKLSVLGNGMSSRQVSRPEDEPICLAIMLALDLDPIIRALPGDRMKEFWNSMSRSSIGIPKSIICRRGRKLQVKGYAWAPATILQEQIELDSNFFRFIREPGSDSRGTLSSRGLEVHFKGYILSGVGSVKTELLELFGMKSIYPWLRDQHGQWYGLGACPNPDLNQEATQLTEKRGTRDVLSKLISEGRPSQYATMIEDDFGDGIFVEIQERGLQCIYVRLLYQVYWLADLSATNKIFESAYGKAQEISHHPDYLRLTSGPLIEEENPNFAQVKMELLLFMEHAVLQAIQSDPSLLLPPEVYPASLAEVFQRQVVMILANCYFVAEPLPETQLWCVE